MSKRIDIGLIGFGLVGKELIQQVQHLNGVKVVGVMNSTKMAFNVDGFNSLEPLIQTLTESTIPSDIGEFTSKLSSLTSISSKVIIDCTSSLEVASLYPNFIAMGFNIITPNKKGFSSDFELFKSINSTANKHDKKVYHESTVGAGLPVIEILNNLVKTGDKIVKVEGIFSGTLSYLFNKFSSLKIEEKSNFSDIVKGAKDLGYTEPDPRDDLNGIDVARKVVILARLIGLDLSLETLETENIVPKELREIESSSEFMTKLPDFDHYFSELNDNALKENHVLRYVGVIDTKGQSSVKLMRYPSTHPFASLTGSDNVVAFTTQRFPSPLIIQGAGAGALVTVHGILADLLKLQESIPSSFQ